MRFFSRRNQEGTPFQHPLNPAPRTAVLLAGFQDSRHLRVFPDGWTGEATRFQPASIAATLPTLETLANQGIEIEHSVIVFTSMDCLLSDYDRDYLWNVFGVPVFEQCLGPGREVLAAECDAHDGLHLLERVSLGQGLKLERATCACGSQVPRLVVCQPLRLAASA